MYGDGVSDDEIFLRFLEERLEAEHPEVSWEIVNTAVGAYNTVIEVEVLRRAPLGDPTVFELHGYQLCLRRSESQRVRVSSNVGESRE